MFWIKLVIIRKVSAETSSFVSFSLFEKLQRDLTIN